MTEAITYLTWRDNVRHGFPCRGKSIWFKRGKNALPTRLWNQIKDGVAKRFVDEKVLVPTHAPIDDVEAAEVNEIEIKPGIVRSPTAARHRAGAATDADVDIQRMRAELAEMKAAMVKLTSGASELAFDPNEASVTEVKELVDALDLDELVAVLAAERAGKGRRGAISAIKVAIASAVSE